MSEADNYRHVGWPHRDVHAVLDRVKAGLPVYWPTHAVPIDQTPYLAFVAKPEGAPKQ